MCLRYTIILINKSNEPENIFLSKISQSLIFQFLFIKIRT